jgi:hypothetical protein
MVFMTPHPTFASPANLLAMHLNLAEELARAANDSYESYDEFFQRELLHGVFELAQECADELKEREDAEEWENAIRELELAKDEISTALKAKNYAHGFVFAVESFQRAIPRPPDID